MILLGIVTVSPGPVYLVMVMALLVVIQVKSMVGGLTRVAEFGKRRGSPGTGGRRELIFARGCQVAVGRPPNSAPQPRLPVDARLRVDSRRACGALARRRAPPVAWRRPAREGSCDAKRACNAE